MLGDAERPLVADANHRQGRFEEILHARALAEELGSHRDAKVHACPLPAEFFQERTQASIDRTWQHGAPEDDDGEAFGVGERVPDLHRDALDLRKNRQSRRSGSRRADADDDDVAAARGVGDTCGDGKPARRASRCDQLPQVRLDDGAPTAIHLIDLQRIHVHTGDGVTAFYLTRCSHSADVPQPDHDDLSGGRHVSSSPCRAFERASLHVCVLKRDGSSVSVAG